MLKLVIEKLHDRDFVIQMLIAIAVCATVLSAAAPMTDTTTCGKACDRSGMAWQRVSPCWGYQRSVACLRPISAPRSTALAWRTVTSCWRCSTWPGCASDLAPPWCA